MLEPSSGGLMANNLRSLRRAALQRQSGRCFYCRHPVWEDEPATFAIRLRIPVRLLKWLRATAEHTRARSDGGNDSTSNIVAACYWCNSRRHRGRCGLAPAADTYGPWVRKMVLAGRWHPLAMYLAHAKHPRYGPASAEPPTERRVHELDSTASL